MELSMSSDMLQQLQRMNSPLERPESNDSPAPEDEKPVAAPQKRTRAPRKSYAAAIAQLQTPTPLEAALVADAMQNQDTLYKHAPSPLNGIPVLTSVPKSGSGTIVVPMSASETLKMGKTPPVLKVSKTADGKQVLVPVTDERMIQMAARKVAASNVEQRKKSASGPPSDKDKNLVNVVIESKPEATSWDDVNKVSDINKKLFVHATGRVKRPMNAFMIWGRRARAEVARSMPACSSNGEVSVRMGELWRSMTDEEKEPYYQEARKLSMYHSEMFPDYEYKPAEMDRCYGPVANKREKSALWKKFCTTGSLSTQQQAEPGTSRATLTVSEAAKLRCINYPPPPPRSRNPLWDNFRRYGNVEGSDSRRHDDDDDLLPLTTNTPSSILSLGSLFPSDDDDDEDGFPTMVPMNRHRLSPNLLETSPEPSGEPETEALFIKEEPRSPEPEGIDPEPPEAEIEEEEEGPVPLSIIRVKREEGDWTVNSQPCERIQAQPETSVKEEPVVHIKTEIDDSDVKPELATSDEEEDNNDVKVREEWEDSETEAWNDEPSRPMKVKIPKKKRRLMVEGEVKTEGDLKTEQKEMTEVKVEVTHSVVGVKTSGEWVCNRCGVGFDNETELSVHMSSHGDVRSERRYQCTHCGLACEDLASLRNHTKDCMDEEPYFCDVCEATFPESHSLMLHKRTHSTSMKTSDPYACLHCEAAFRSRAALIRHVRFHTGDKPYCCSLCKCSFGSRDDLWDHKRLSHPNLFILSSSSAHCGYKCEFCSLEFENSAEFGRHLINHTGVKPFQCVICKAQFSKSDHLTDHYEVHNAAK